MRIDLLFPQSPTQVGGIAHHSAQLAATLAAAGATVRYITARPTPGDFELATAAGYTVVDGWQGSTLRRVRRLLKLVSEAPADVVLMQFEQFAYGRYGFNPSAAGILRQIGKRSPSTLRVLYAHENYVDPTTIKRALMWFYQRLQFRHLTSSADKVLLSTEAWLDSLPRRVTDVEVVPAFSNVPVSPVRPDEVHRMRALLTSATRSCVWFGNVSQDRDPYLRALLRSARRIGGLHVVYVGVDDDAFVSACQSADFTRYSVVSRPPLDEISKVLQACDLAIAPYPEGATTRRGTLLASLANGVPTLTTLSPRSDRLIQQAAKVGALFVSESTSVESFAAKFDEIASRPRHDLQVTGAAGKRFYETHFSVERVAALLLAT